MHISTDAPVCRLYEKGVKLLRNYATEVVYHVFLHNHFCGKLKSRWTGVPAKQLIPKLKWSDRSFVEELHAQCTRTDQLAMVGHGGALVETTPFDRRVVGSNPALAAM